VSGWAKVALAECSLVGGLVLLVGCCLEAGPWFWLCWVFNIVGCLSNWMIHISMLPNLVVELL